MKVARIDMCACMGPMHGDPYCICEMKQRGLSPSKSYDWTKEEIDKLEAALAEMFQWKTKKKPTLPSKD